MMIFNFLRSFLFNFLYIAGSFFWSIVFLWTLVLPRRWCLKILSETYGRYLSFVFRYVMGLKLEIRGVENLPKDSRFVIASKHQSAYETFMLPYRKKLFYPAVVFKKELVYFPLWGLYLLRLGFVAVDRSKGTQAMRKMVKGCRRVLDAEGRSMVIFPQGTRVAPGVKAPYKSGIAKVYKDLDVTIVPMALNTGVFWGRNKFLKRPGTVIFEFLPPIKPGKKPLAMLAELEENLEAACDRLLAESQ